MAVRNSNDTFSAVELCSIITANVFLFIIWSTLKAMMKIYEEAEGPNEEHSLVNN
jgi:hypothetical protein